MDTFDYGGVGLAMTAYGDFIFQAMFAATAALLFQGLLLNASNLVLS